MSPLTCQLLLNFQAQVGKSFLHLNKKNSLRIPPSYMSIGRCSRVNFSRVATRARGKTRRCTAACSHEVWHWKVTNAYDYKAECVYDSSKKSLWVAIMNRHKLLARPISNDPKHVHFQHFAWAKVQHAVLEMPLVCTSVWWTTCGSKVLSPASIRSRAWICESCFSQITLHISLYTSLYDLFTILQLVWQLLLTSTDSTDYSCEFFWPCTTHVQCCCVHSTVSACSRTRVQFPRQFKGPAFGTSALREAPSKVLERAASASAFAAPISCSFMQNLCKMQQAFKMQGLQNSETISSTPSSL